MLYRVHHAWAGFQLTTLLVIGTDGIDSYKSNYHTITTAACKILTIKDLQQTSLWSWRLSIAISPFQEAFLLAVIKSYKEKKKKKSVSQDVILCTICVLLMVIQWKYSAYKSEKIQLYITGSRLSTLSNSKFLVCFFFSIQDNETYNLD
jgi:hypothetical protein